MKVKIQNTHLFPFSFIAYLKRHSLPFPQPTASFQKIIIPFVFSLPWQTMLYSKDWYFCFDRWQSGDSEVWGVRYEPHLTSKYNQLHCEDSSTLRMELGNTPQHTVGLPGFGFFPPSVVELLKNLTQVIFYFLIYS